MRLEARLYGISTGVSFIRQYICPYPSKKRKPTVNFLEKYRHAPLLWLGRRASACGASPNPMGSGLFLGWAGGTDGGSRSERAQVIGF